MTNLFIIAILFVSALTSNPDLGTGMIPPNPKLETQNNKRETRDSKPIPPDWPTFEEALEKAQRHGKKVLVFVDAPWCGWCKKMDADFFADAQYMEDLKRHFIPTRLGIDDNETMLRYQGYRLSEAALCDLLGVAETPATVFLNPDGTIISHFPSFAEPDFYAALLAYVGSNAYESMSFEKFLENS